MIAEIVGDNGSRFIIAAAAVALGLLCLVAVLWIMRNRPSSPFIRGGKNRQPRLAVLDAAAVDTRRRLVLVRRDDVEHLIMIGGPTDIVIESRIGGAPLADLQPAATPRPTAERRPAPIQQPQEQRPQPAVRPVEAPATPSGVSAMGNVLYGESFDAAPATRAAQPANLRPRTEVPVARPTPPVERQPTPAQQRPQPAAPAPLVQHARTPEDILDAARNRVLATEQRPPQPAAVPVQAAQPVPAQDSKAAAADFERILDAEISGDLGRLGAGPDVRLDGETRGAAPVSGRQEPRFAAGQPRNEPTLEEEMNRMLGEMSADRKP